MAGPGRIGLQLHRPGQGQRPHPVHLRGVDVEVDRAGMVGIALQGGQQQFPRPVQVTAVVPQGRRDHPGIRGDHRGLVVRRMRPGIGVHGGGEGQVPRPLASAPVIAVLQGGRQGLLVRRSGPCQPGGPVGQGGQFRRVLRGDVEIDGRAAGPGLPPDAQGAGGVEGLGALEGAHCRPVGKGMGKLHAVVEIGLGLGAAGGDGKAARPVAGQQGLRRSWRGLDGLVLRMADRGRGQGRAGGVGPCHGAGQGGCRGQDHQGRSRRRTQVSCPAHGGLPVSGHCPPGGRTSKGAAAPPHRRWRDPCAAV